MLRHCLKERHFKKEHYPEWQEVKESLGYETLTDMLYIMYMEMGLTTYDISDIIGFGQRNVRDKLRKIKGVVMRNPGKNVRIKKKGNNV